SSPSKHAVGERVAPVMNLGVVLCPRLGGRKFSFFHHDEALPGATLQGGRGRVVPANRSISFDKVVRRARFSLLLSRTGCRGSARPGDRGFFHQRILLLKGWKIRGEIPIVKLVVLSL